MSRVVLTEPFGMAALLFRQLLLFYLSSTSLLTLNQQDSSDGAASPEEEPPTHHTADSHLSLRPVLQLLQGSNIPETLRGLLLQAVVICWFVVPMWAALLTLKFVLGYCLKVFAGWYNPHYDQTFKRMFKNKR
jgi:hypothetical protein